VCHEKIDKNNIEVGFFFWSMMEKLH